MPNQNYRAISDLGSQVGHFLENYVKDAEADCPLDHATIQHMVVKPETLALIHSLIADHKYADIDTYSEVYFGLPDHTDIKRSPQLHANAAGTQRFYLPHGYRNTGGQGHRRQQVTRKQVSLIGSFDVLDETQLTKLINWVEKAVLAQRIFNLVSKVTTDYLVSCQPSLWHVMIQMPTIKLAFNAQTRAWSNDSPRRPHHYAWHSEHRFLEWKAHNEKYFEIMQRVMLETSLLKDVKNPRVRVYNWVKFGDETV